MKPARQYHCLHFLASGRAICRCGRWQRNWRALGAERVKAEHREHVKFQRLISQQLTANKPNQ